MSDTNYLRKPDWIKYKIPSDSNYNEVNAFLTQNKLSTVCREAKCPNIAECWENRSATIMILGKICTRNCRFCAVTSRNIGEELDINEPAKVANFVNKFNLKYVVITSVDRDDLKDYGSEHYAQTIKQIKNLCKETRVEVLIPDFSNQLKFLKIVVDSGPNVIAHNLETVSSLSGKVRDNKSSYDKSLEVLKNIKILNSSILSKTGLMIGIGETTDEIKKTIIDIKENNVDILTIGQYLQPTKKNLPVLKYYSPEEFEEIKIYAKSKGIKFVQSGPMVRSSYKAGEID
jgi:lipoyl synthase